MRYKQKLLLILVLVVMGTGAWLWRQHWPLHRIAADPPGSSGPAPTFQPKHQEPAADSPGPEPQPAADQPPGASLVSLESEQQKQNFLTANGLAAADLQPSALLGTYVVSRSSSKLEAAGATLAPRQQYHALLTPNDPIYPQWYTDKISAPAAWDVTTGASSVTVAVIDTGFALNHEDLVGRWAAGGKDFINNDNDPSAGTTNPGGAGVNHGTMTAGLVGATGNNGVGVASTNWGVKILPLQSLDDNGSGYTDGITAAVNYAVAQGAKVISMSLGSTGNDPLLQAAINNAMNGGVAVVAAAGNCGSPSSYSQNGCSGVGQMLYPAKYNGVIAVGASDQNDQRASFSSYGPQLTLLAPGSGSIRTTNWSALNQTALYTDSANGTSFATPIVAGAIGLLRAQYSNLSLSDIRTVITSSVDKVAAMNGATRTDQYGYGRLNTLKAVSLSGLSCPVSLPTLSNVVGAAGGGRVLRNHFSGSTDLLALTFLNNTGSGCIEAHTWNSSAQGWVSNVATNHPSLNPADNELVTGNTTGDGRSDLTLIKYRNNGSGRIEVHTWDPGYQHWVSNVAANHPAISPANARVVAADQNGDGRDELSLILYSGTGSGKIEVHTWLPGQQTWLNNLATNHPIIDVGNARVIAADQDGDGRDELSLVLFRGTGSGHIEVHTWNPDQQTWRSNVATNHPIIDPANAEVVASDQDGDGKDELSLVLYRGTGSGRIEVHTWNPDQQTWRSNVATNHPVLP